MRERASKSSSEAQKLITDLFLDPETRTNLTARADDQIPMSYTQFRTILSKMTVHIPVPSQTGEKPRRYRGGMVIFLVP